MKIKSKTVDAVYKQLEGPINHFLETGLHADPVLLPEEWKNIFIRPAQTRRIVRAIAKELGRPFVQVGTLYTMYEFNAGTRRWESRDPVLLGGYIQVPRRKYLTPLVAPLMAGDRGPAPRRFTPYYGAPRHEPGIYSQHGASYWLFHIHGFDLFKSYLEAIKEDDHIRAALRLPPKGDA